MVKFIFVLALWTFIIIIFNKGSFKINSHLSGNLNQKINYVINKDISQTL